ncbi:MAG: RND family efflux transporter MFP subunit [Lysobacterales bacterium]
MIKSILGTRIKLLFPAFLLVFLPVEILLAQGVMPAANVKVEYAQQQALAPVTQVVGTVVSRNDARLSAEVEGRLVNVVDVGVRVKKGDALAKIEDTQLKLMQDQLNAEINRAQARLTFLESEEQRYEKLTRSNLAAATKLDETRSNRDIARGDLLVAQSRLAQNNDKLERTTISAPFDGVVVERLMTPGERVDEGSDVIRLIDQQNLEVIARAPLENYPFVYEGLTLDLRAGSLISSGVVRTVVAVGDENTHQFEIRMDLEGSPLPAGLTVRVSVPVSEVKEVLAVPRDALVLRPEGITVFIVDANNHAQQVNVTTGIGAGDKIEIFGAVSPGDRVVIRGNERLQSGQSVNIQES